MCWDFLQGVLHMNTWRGQINNIAAAALSSSWMQSYASEHLASRVFCHCTLFSSAVQVQLRLIKCSAGGVWLKVMVIRCQYLQRSNCAAWIHAEKNPNQKPPLVLFCGKTHFHQLMRLKKCSLNACVLFQRTSEISVTFWAGKWRFQMVWELMFKI